MDSRAFVSALLLCCAVSSTGTASEPALLISPYFVEGHQDSPVSGAVSSVPLSATDTGVAPAALAARLPNFFVAESGAHSFNDTCSLRGLTNTPIFGEPSVTFYLDEIPLGGGFSAPDSLFGLAQASLFRGPGQIAGFGRSGSAGVVELVTPTPSEGWRDELDVRAGNHNTRATSLAASGARENTDAFVAAGYAARDGFVHNSTLNRDVDHRESENGLVRLGFSCLPDLKVSVVLQGERARDGEQPLVPLGGPLYSIDRHLDGFTDFSSLNGGITTALTQPWGRLSATTSFNDWHLGPYRSLLAFGPAELANDTDLRRFSFNEEVNAAWTADSGLHGRCGAYFSKESTRGAFTRSFPPVVIEASTYTLYTQRLAAFADTTVPIAPGLSLNAGLRAEGAQKRMDRTTLVPVGDSYVVSSRSAALLPQARLAWDCSPGVGLFASLGGGYKPGGFSAFTGNRALSAFGPERTVGAEFGMEAATRDKTLRWGTRVFAYDIHGYQIERSFATGAAADDYLVVNAPRARSAGFESELAWSPAGPWTARAAFGMTDTSLRDFTDPYTHRNFSGLRAPFVPRNNFSLQLDFRSPSGWFARAAWTVYGRTYYTEGEDPFFSQRAYGLVGARAGYAARHWTIAAYIENAFDQGYYSSISAGTGHGTPGAPRTFGGEFSAAF